MKKAIHDSSTGDVVLLDMSAEEEAALVPTAEQIMTREAEAARQSAAIAAKEELALDTLSKKSYAEIETYIRGTVTNLPTAVDLLVKMGKLIKALVERG